VTNRVRGADEVIVVERSGALVDEREPFGRPFRTPFVLARLCWRAVDQGDLMNQLELYRHGKDMAVDLLRSLDDDALETTCAACPDWSIRDVVAHHVHYLGACATGEVPQVMQDALMGDDEARPQAAEARDAWTQAGVERRRPLPLSSVLEEWDEVVATMPDHAARAVLDLTMHLFDIKETLGDDRDRTSPLVGEALAGYYYFALSTQLEHEGTSVGLVCTDSGATLITDGQTAVVSGTAYDLLRAVGGRRSRLETDSTLDWGDAPETVRAHFSVYGWPTPSIV
jgi:uncharacterized protein (TIGR03083 family)